MVVAASFVLHFGQKNESLPVNIIVTIAVSITTAELFPHLAVRLIANGIV